MTERLRGEGVDLQKLCSERADEIDRLRDLLSELYQVFGTLDASEEVLTRVLAASEGRAFSNQPSLLPYAGA